MKSIIFVITILFTFVVIATEEPVEEFTDVLPIAPQSYDIYAGEEQVAFKNPGGKDFNAIAIDKNEKSKVKKIAKPSNSKVIKNKKRNLASKKNVKRKKLKKKKK